MIIDVVFVILHAQKFLAILAAISLKLIESLQGKKSGRTKMCTWFVSDFEHLP